MKLEFQIAAGIVIGGLALFLVCAVMTSVVVQKESEAGMARKLLEAKGE